MDTTKTTNYKPKEFAARLGVSVKTLRRWDREGVLQAKRTPTNRRYYTEEQYRAFQGIHTEKDERAVVIYARVSSRNRRRELMAQTAFLKTFCNARGMIVEKCIEEYGSGLDYKREAWNGLLEMVMAGQVKTIVITGRDRFVRFGYEWFEQFCHRYQTEILVVNNEWLSPAEELAQDVQTVLAAFGERLCSLRKYGQQIQQDREIAGEILDQDIPREASGD